MTDEDEGRAAEPIGENSPIGEIDSQSFEEFEEKHIDEFFSRLLNVRQDVDQRFRNQVGLTAYPHFEILLLVRASDELLQVEDIAMSLFLAPRLTQRYIDLLISKNLLEHNDGILKLTHIGEGILTGIVRNHLFQAFKLVD